MKNRILLSIAIISSTISFGQNENYASHIRKADSLYTSGEYKKSGMEYSEAFKSFGWTGYKEDRYNAACSWALANVPDSAFFQLERIATKSNYTEYAHISIDPDLNSLHSDRRWAPLLSLIKQNKEKEEVNFDKPLVEELDSIFKDDQQYRLQLDDLNKKFGWQSKEVADQWRIISEKDSINEIKVLAILNSKGWLGADVIGEQGNTTLFLVIQHADIAIQEKYLPMMRDAVKNGRAKASSLALLEDRVALRQGRKQIYGSQIGTDPQTQENYVLPLEDPENVDKRRAAVGLRPIAEYINYWHIKWDVEQYKKDLPRYMEMEKKGQ